MLLRSLGHLAADQGQAQEVRRGIVNVIVGFAPLKPAEFVVLYIQQIAGQLAT